MLDKIRSALIGVSLFVILALGGLYMYVQIKGGDGLLGNEEGSLEPTNFSTLSHTTSDDGFLLCSPDICPNAEIDEIPETFQLSAAKLRQLVADFTDNYSNINTLSFNFAANQFEFTEKLPGKPFPTVVSVKIIEVTPYSSQLVIYAYRPVGDTSKAQNRETVERWLSLMQADAAS
ncbi:MULTISPECIES: hypothetical protein [Kordiimonas]|uniref:hypothetical protein n=1 Tax=Kordiimonas TaxID=288021 RepID=UPI001FF2D90F|nr:MULTISPECIES: hypothetical protein [Kordiimonas]MCK0069105.1 hypothetical protein [Kordiimonas laminariae]UTW58441.1 hypothetical protein KFE96_16720 [Kordiimonas sp. SCSIO 12603]